MLVEHIAANQYVWFLLPKCRTNQNFLQVVNLQSDLKNRKFYNFARESLEPHSSVFDQSEMLNHLCRQDRPVSGCVDLSWLVYEAAIRLGTANGDIHEGCRRIQAVDVTIEGHAH